MIVTKSSLHIQLSYFDLGKFRIITNVGEFELVDIGVSVLLKTFLLGFCLGVFKYCLVILSIK